MIQWAYGIFLPKRALIYDDAFHTGKHNADICIADFPLLYMLIMAKA
jgi:hypothetical protein